MQPFLKFHLNRYIALAFIGFLVLLTAQGLTRDDGIRINNGELSRIVKVLNCDLNLDPFCVKTLTELVVDNCNQELRFDYYGTEHAILTGTWNPQIAASSELFDCDQLGNLLTSKPQEESSKTTTWILLTIFFFPAIVLSAQPKKLICF